MIPAIVAYFVGGFFWLAITAVMWHDTEEWPYSDAEDVQLAAIGVLVTPIWPLVIIALALITLAEIPAGIRAVSKSFKRVVKAARGEHSNNINY